MSLQSVVVADGTDGEGSAVTASGEQGGEGTGGGGGDDDEMSELMSNRDFLRSVLSTLPGVNPEEALQNLEEMADQQTENKV